MNVSIKPGCAQGCIQAPASKSMAHRQLVAAALTQGKTVIEGLSFSQDIMATIDCLRAMGAAIEQYDGYITITGFNPLKITEKKVLFCRESGSTIRFLVPIALLSGAPFLFLGQGRLLDRPMQVYEKICDQVGAFFDQTIEYVNVRGPLIPTRYKLPGDISSQFITGMLYALPLLDGDSHIRLTSRLQSRPYIDLTLSVLKNSGIEIIQESARDFHIPGNQRYKAVSGGVEGDFSNAAFLEAFRLLGDNVTVTGLPEDSLQGDRVYRTYFRKLQKGCPTLKIDNCPDLAPILMTIACLFNGCTLQGTSRLKLKESDRGIAMQKELKKCGARITVNDNTIVVEKSELHPPKRKLCGHNDHRVVMALTVLATRLGATITDAHAVNKSYPDFWNVMRELGISYYFHQ